MTGDFLFSIGGLVGRFRIQAPSGFLRELEARYAPFLLPPSPRVREDFSFSLRTRKSAPPSGEKLSVRPGRIRRWDFDVRCGQGTCADNLYTFDTLLRILWSERLDGALVHGCGIRDGDAGYLFPGVSGAGKTTLARKVGEVGNVLSDEIIPVQGRWRISASPFWGEFGRGEGSLRSFPLAVAAFPKKGRRFKVAKLTRAEAARRILETMVCFRTDAKTVKRNLEWASALAKEIRCVEITTTRATPMERILNALRTDAPEVAPNLREIASELREELRRHGACAFVATGGSMRPGIRPGDLLFIRRAEIGSIAAGEEILYWVPGRGPDEDRLICHRVIRRRGNKFVAKGDTLGHLERFEHGADAEVLGRVTAVSGSGRGGKAARWARVVASLAAMPVRRLREALR